MENMSGRLSIFVDSFDDYSDLWDNLFKIFGIYWPDCKYPVYLVNNEKDYKYKNVRVIHTGREENFIDRTIKGVEAINEEYIFYFLDDYFLGKRVTNEFIENVLKYMDDNNLFYYSFEPRYPKGKENIVTLSKGRKYNLDLALCIWKRQIFLEYLYEIKKSGMKSPWEFELYFVNKYKDIHGDVALEGAVYDQRDMVGYHNGVLQGKWIRKTLTYYARRGIQIDKGNRKVMSIPETFFYNSEIFFLRHSNDQMKAIVKRVMVKLGLKFKSDF